MHLHFTALAAKNLCPLDRGLSIEEELNECCFTELPWNHRTMPETRPPLSSETYLSDHLRNRDNLGIKDSYMTP